MNQRQQPDDPRNRGYVEPGTPQSSHRTRGASVPISNSCYDHYDFINNRDRKMNEHPNKSCK